MDQRSARAQQLLAEPIVVEAFDKVEQGYTEAWKHAGTAEARENLHLAITIIDKVKRHLQAAVADGELEDMIEEDMQPEKRWWK